MKKLFLLLVFLVGCKDVPTLNRTTSDIVYRPGKPLAVMIHVVPDSNHLAYALEERPPVGWVVSGINNQGNFVGGLIKWGVFFDNTPRDFNYLVVPPLNQTADGLFSGVVSFDGSSDTITGVTVVPKDLLPPASPI